MKALRVEFTLRTPMVVPSTGKTLDAVLAWAAVRREEFYGNPNSWAAQHDTGVARHVVGEQWCPMASTLEAEWASEPEQLSYIRRQKVEDYANAWLDGVIKKAPRIDTSSGHMKAGLFFQPIRYTSVVRAWVVVDDEAQFTALLPWVTHIGKLWHKDCGAVRRFEVFDDEAAVERWRNRPLPLHSPCAGESHVQAMGALQAPYWKRENHQVVLMPGD